MIKDVKKNIDDEIEILREISILSKRIDTASPTEKKLMMDSLYSLARKMKDINRAIPELLAKTIPEKPVEKKQETMVEKQSVKEKATFVPEKIIPKVEIEREAFMKELNIAENLLKKLRKSRTKEKEKIEEFKKARGYLRWANKMFLDTSAKMIKKGYFSTLPVELKKSNLDILFESYVAMILFSVMISFIASIILLIFFLFFSFSLTWPIITLYDGSILTRFFELLLIPIVLPIIVFFALYFYPSAEKSSISNKIDEELPFAVIHMSSISGSGIEPTEIFRIIGLSKDYPALRKEIRKVLNQINIYGYDLVTALNNVSKSTSNSHLAELFGGLSTTINSGGNLSEFFQKRADSLLTSYKLEKEKSIKSAETFMDIYISVVIAAPMILMLMLVMITISGIQTPFSPFQLTMMTIGGVALVNVLFLGFLQMKQ